jgi:biopolymer transport protein ExbD
MNISRRKFKVEVPSVAMGDIAFNLLVFFVILARAQDDSHVKWEPASAEVLEKGNRAKVSIAIDKEFKLYLNGREIGADGLTAAVESKLAGLPAGERTVLLKISRDAQALQFQKVLESVSEAGGEIVHVLQERKETPQ